MERTQEPGPGETGANHGQPASQPLSRVPSRRPCTHLRAGGLVTRHAARLLLESWMLGRSCFLGLQPRDTASSCAHGAATLRPVFEKHPPLRLLLLASLPRVKKPRDF